MTSKIAGFFKLLIAAQFVLVAAQASAGNYGDKAKSKDIIDTAVAAGQFTTLAAALEAADLVGTLKGDGPFTVFAPTEEAFAAALDALGLTPEELLADIGDTSGVRALLDEREDGEWDRELRLIFFSEF